MYDRILVPTDGSRSAEAAARHGVVLAKAFDASLHVISVVAGRDRGEQLSEPQARDAVARVEALVEDAGVGCRSTVEHGRPHEAILSYASATDVDLVVMGTHGRGGLSRLLVGSVADRVIRSSDDPVVAVPPRAIDRETERYQRVLLPTDGGPAAGAAVEHALSVAERMGATVRVLGVIEGVTGLPALGDPLREAATEAVEAVAERASDREVTLTTHVQPGTPHEVINRFATAHGIDLVAMGTHGRSGVRRQLLGSVTDRVVRTSDVPVLTVRQDTG